MRKGSLFQRVAFWAIISVVGAPTLPAAASGDSRDWSRVSRLTPDTSVVVLLSVGDTVTGTLVDAGLDSMTVRVGNQLVGIQNQVIARDMIRQVAIENVGGPWYSIPLVVGAAAAAGAVGYAISSKATCSNSTDRCSKARGVIIVLSAAGAGILTYRATRGTKVKVIYRVPKK